MLFFFGIVAGRDGNLRQRIYYIKNINGHKSKNINYKSKIRIGRLPSRGSAGISWRTPRTKCSRSCLVRL